MNGSRGRSLKKIDGESTESLSSSIALSDATAALSYSWSLALAVCLMLSSRWRLWSVILSGIFGLFEFFACEF